jgi:nicotinate-nucleotide pyrophosphorylase (carboxylating)
MPSAETPTTKGVDWQAVLALPEVQTLIALAIAEDVGTGDATTQAIFAEPRQARARIITRRNAVVAGLSVADIVFRYFDRSIRFVPRVREGEPVAADAALCEIEGDLRAILTGERCVLNFLMRLSGIATAAAHAVAAVPPGTKARIYDTRKTTPGWRRLDKAAVRTGGAENHRIGLFDGVLIKDNHVAASGSVRGAVERARALHGDRLPIEIEIDHLGQLEDALAAAPDIVLLDNFSDADMAEAVSRCGGRALLEASGGITFERIPAVARTGVDRISIGALTHSVTPADLSLEIEP